LLSQPRRSIGILRLPWLTHHRREAPAEGGCDRQRDTRQLANKIKESAAIQTQYLAAHLGLDGSGSRAIGQKSHFSEWLSPSEHFDWGFAAARCA
jgi:hypothetical protein